MQPNPPDRLLQAARDAAKNAYAPYSNFPVGAAVETRDGSVFLGANMENISFGLSLCAEVGALQAATTAGKNGQILRIAIVGGREGKAGHETITPCGRCRQLLNELSKCSGVDIEVWCANDELSAVKMFTVSELLPYAFDSKII